VECAHHGTHYSVAPTNAAFEKITWKEGTFGRFDKGRKHSKLQDILKYHVSIGVFQARRLYRQAVDQFRQIVANNIFKLKIWEK